MREFKRTILIVDDNELNRDILSDLLSDVYNVLEADNGQTALDLLNKKDTIISAILLDMQMPIMDGFTFLSIVKKDRNLAQIPIIVTTASDDIETEIKCLNNGAVDFVTKPLHTDVVRARLKNVICLHESVTMLSATEYDTETGLHTRNAFLHHVNTMRKYISDSRFDLIVMSIIGFEQLIDKYGMEKPLALLRRIGNILRLPDNNNVISAHFGMGEFVVIADVDGGALEGKEAIRAFLKDFEKDPIIPGVNIKFALYENLENTVSAQTLCERAFGVLERIKNQYGVTIGYYSPEVQKEIDLLAKIESDMETALTEKQFIVYYQPKFSVSGEKNCIAGAEALIRWIHPTLGFMNPGIFIPLFEQTGFITNVDLYIIEAVCSDLQKWLENGGPVYPVSINLSRVDFSRPDLAEKITSIIDRYNIPHDLIHFEITESAFSSRDDMIKEAIHKLHNNEFIFELDDFGSGYSTLSSLQCLDIDIVKLDLSLIRNDDPESEKSILNFAHKLMKMMGIKTVQEGVETEKELERVRSLGCDYVQGYYFAKPLSKKEYIEFCNKLI